MPFQLYPHLPAGHSNEGVVKDELFSQLIDQRAPEMTHEQRKHRADGLAAAWRAEGLTLKSPPTGLNGGGGRMGSSFDAQRLILLARHLGKEDAMIEEIYAANHSRDECLSDWGVLLACARRAGIPQAERALASGWGVRETVAKIEQYKEMGVTAVPVVVVDSVDGAPLQAVLSSGAPEMDYLRELLGHLIGTGKLPWKAGAQPMPLPQPKGNWQPNAPAGDGCSRSRTPAELQCARGGSGECAGSGGERRALAARKDGKLSGGDDAAARQRGNGTSGGSSRKKAGGTTAGADGGRARARVLSMLSKDAPKGGGGGLEDIDDDGDGITCGGADGRCTGGNRPLASRPFAAPTRPLASVADANVDRRLRRSEALGLGLPDNLLDGSRKPTAARPLAFRIDADFVTCTQ